MSSHEDSEASCAEQDEQHTLTVGKAETGGDGRMGWLKAFGPDSTLMAQKPHPLVLVDNAR